VDTLGSIPLPRLARWGVYAALIDQLQCAGADASDSLVMTHFMAAAAALLSAWVGDAASALSVAGGGGGGLYGSDADHAVAASEARELLVRVGAWVRVRVCGQRKWP